MIRNRFASKKQLDKKSKPLPVQTNSGNIYTEEVRSVHFAELRFRVTADTSQNHEYESIRKSRCLPEESGYNSLNANTPDIATIRTQCSCFQKTKPASNDSHYHSADPTMPCVAIICAHYESIDKNLSPATDVFYDTINAFPPENFQSLTQYETIDKSLSPDKESRYYTIDRTINATVPDVVTKSNHSP